MLWQRKDIQPCNNISLLLHKIHNIIDKNKLTLLVGYDCLVDGVSGSRSYNVGVGRVGEIPVADPHVRPCCQQEGVTVCCPQVHSVNGMVGGLKAQGKVTFIKYTWF